jgi:hypothetical protein
MGKCICRSTVRAAGLLHCYHDPVSSSSWCSLVHAACIILHAEGSWPFSSHPRVLLLGRGGRGTCSFAASCCSCGEEAGGWVCVVCAFA